MFSMPVVLLPDLTPIQQLLTAYYACPLSKRPARETDKHVARLLNVSTITVLRARKHLTGRGIVSYDQQSGRYVTKGARL